MAWQPIETAPKDGTRILLYRPTAIYWAQIVCGSWDADEYAPKPRPYWQSDRQKLEGLVSARNNMPTHWMPLPAPPQDA